MNFVHVPVLLAEAINALNIDPAGIYVDATAGGGGHSEAIAKCLINGRLISLDQDPDAVEAATARLAPYKCAEVIHANFSDMAEAISEKGIQSVHGVLMDLGVSSHQLDSAPRGFSFHRDAPLDMRMSQKGASAADLVNGLTPKELSGIIFDYGEEKFAFKITAAIMAERESNPITTTARLAEIIKSAVPAAYCRDGHPARKTFQALRIAVNSEMDNLDKGLSAAFEILKPGGILAVITFHSLEDRMTKRFFAKQIKGCICPPDFPVCICNNRPKGQLLFKKPVTASENELQQNQRSRSAKLRAIRKL